MPETQNLTANIIQNLVERPVQQKIMARPGTKETQQTNIKINLQNGQKLHRILKKTQPGAGGDQCASHKSLHPENSIEMAC
jgi:hypothetical protein